MQQLVISSVSYYINFFFPKQNVKREKNFARAGKKLFHNFFLFFFYYLAASQPTFSHYRGGTLTHPMLITAFYIFGPKVTGSLITRLGL